jgi:hypothetical protein
MKFELPFTDCESTRPFSTVIEEWENRIRMNSRINNKRKLNEPLENVLADSKTKVAITFL